MSRIDDFLHKGKLKKFNVSGAMIMKELSVGKKDLEAAESSFKIEGVKNAVSKIEQYLTGG